mmetsp:Transcript_4106/g.12867  ORF Transcript_4106/g.12867 Transcript_4106/m.12867 type:complete len:267 (-) Transcript_4106:400-1200(-)
MGGNGGGGGTATKQNEVVPFKDAETVDSALRDTPGSQLPLGTRLLIRFLAALARSTMLPASSKEGLHVWGTPTPTFRRHAGAPFPPLLEREGRFGIPGQAASPVPQARTTGDPRGHRKAVQSSTTPTMASVNVSCASKSWCITCRTRRAAKGRARRPSGTPGSESVKTANSRQTSARSARPSASAVSWLWRQTSMADGSEREGSKMKSGTDAAHQWSSTRPHSAAEGVKWTVQSTRSRDAAAVCSSSSSRRSVRSSFSRCILRTLR